MHGKNIYNLCLYDTSCHIVDLLGDCIRISVWIYAANLAYEPWPRLEIPQTAIDVADLQRHGWSWEWFLVHDLFLQVPARCYWLYNLKSTGANQTMCWSNTAKYYIRNTLDCSCCRNLSTPSLGNMRWRRSRNWMPTTEVGLIQINMTHYLMANPGHWACDYRSYPFTPHVTMDHCRKAKMAVTPTLLVSLWRSFGRKNYYYTRRAHYMIKTESFTRMKSLILKARRRSWVDWSGWLCTGSPCLEGSFCKKESKAIEDQGGLAGCRFHYGQLPRLRLPFGKNYGSSVVASGEEGNMSEMGNCAEDSYNSWGEGRRLGLG